MKCNVVLCGEGCGEDFSCAGELQFNGKNFSLSYIFGGDKCLLTYDGSILRHRKGGEIPVSLEFIQGKNTLCKFGDGKLSGEIPVFTENLQIEISTQKIYIYVVYELGGERKEMKISAERI